MYYLSTNNLLLLLLLNDIMNVEDSKQYLDTIRATIASVTYTYSQLNVVQVANGDGQRCQHDGKHKFRYN